MLPRSSALVLCGCWDLLARPDTVVVLKSFVGLFVEHPKLDPSSMSVGSMHNNKNILHC